ncbi:MAG TPA: GtrA family protein [Patescibacteria group bacterium]|nr:GtrA family protein [Patescibacteria group bacterium]
MVKMIMSKQFLKYIMVGGLATLLDFIFLYILVEFVHLHYLLAAIISIVVIVWISFSLNKFWTFANSEKKYFQQFIKYIISHSVGLAINLLILASLVQFFHLWYLFAKIFATFAAAVTNFWLVKRFIFLAKDDKFNHI